MKRDQGGAEWLHSSAVGGTTAGRGSVGMELRNGSIWQGGYTEGHHHALFLTAAWCQEPWVLTSSKIKDGPVGQEFLLLLKGWVLLGLALLRSPHKRSRKPAMGC